MGHDGDQGGLHSDFFFLYVDNQLAGYLKLNEAPSQSDLNDDASLEIERIYIRSLLFGRISYPDVERVQPEDEAKVIFRHSFAKFIVKSV